MYSNTLWSENVSPTSAVCHVCYYNNTLTGYSGPIVVFDCLSVFVPVHSGYRITVDRTRNAQVRAQGVRRSGQRDINSDRYCGVEKMYVKQYYIVGVEMHFRPQLYCSQSTIQ